MIHQKIIENKGFGFSVYVMTLRSFAIYEQIKADNPHLKALEFKSRIYLNGDEQKEFEFCANGLHEKNIQLAGMIDGRNFSAIVSCNKDFNKTKLIIFNYENSTNNTGQRSSV